MKALILGSSGMVGSEVLEICKNNPKIASITVISREKSARKSKKITEIIHSDFKDFSPIRKSIQKHDLCFYCIGVYQNKVDEKRFIEVTYDYLMAFSKVAQNKKMVFLLFSAAGANQNSKILFQKWKGMAEVGIQRFLFKRVHFFRPWFISPTTPRNNPPWYERYINIIYPLLDRFFPKYCIKSKTIAQAMVTVAINGSEKKIFETLDMRDIAKR